MKLIYNKTKRESPNNFYIEVESAIDEMALVYALHWGSHVLNKEMPFSKDFKKEMGNKMNCLIREINKMHMVKEGRNPNKYDGEQ